ncbi:hypothetical protein cyc_09202 [Cyclospora cayetanensis]|uniref:Uncharacterized protein n=1 Tax=Cyclospora cayetanensis TaxID=88456 RepID=A0A1D3D9R9_9EIME|nr:hypothetical protein cyc_09202 [Cyclospora cayetanensis]
MNLKERQVFKLTWSRSISQFRFPFYCAQAEVLKRQATRDVESTLSGMRLRSQGSADSSLPTNQQEWMALLAHRDSTIQELEETNAILTAKADSLQKLLQLRDAKIELLTKALRAAAAPPST